MGIEVEGLEFGVEGLGLRVEGLGLGVESPGHGRDRVHQRRRRPGSDEGSYLRLVDGCITQL